MQCTLSVPLAVARTITFQYLFLHLFPYDRHIARIMRELVERPTTACFPQTMCFPWCDDLNSGEVEGNLTLIVSTRKHFKEGARKTSRKTGFRECTRPTWSSSILHQQELTMFLRQRCFDSPLSKCLPSSEIRCYVRDCEARLPLRMMDGCVGSWTMNRLLISGEQLSVIFCLS